MSQFAADTLGVPVEKVRFELGDSAFPIAPNNGGSWLTASVGPAVLGACGELKKKVLEQFGHWPNEQELASLSAPIQTEFTAEPNKDEREKCSFFSYDAVFVEVHVDLFGQVRVKRATGVYDADRMINAKLVLTQIMPCLIFVLVLSLYQVM